MSLLETAAQHFLKSSGASGLDTGQVVTALQGLIGGDGIAGLVAKLQGQGMTQLLGSFLGNGANESMGASQVLSLFGSDKVSAFASQLGIDQGTATEGLASTIPELIDQSSKGGSLLDSAGGAGGLLGAAKGFFK